MVFDCVEDRASPTNASVELQDGELRQPVGSLMTWTEEERRRRNPCPPDTRTVQSRLRDEESVTRCPEATCGYATELLTGGDEPVRRHRLTSVDALARVLHELQARKLR